jgi:hypothetical protein
MVKLQKYRDILLMPSCSRCLQILPISSFHKDSKKSGKLRSDCRKCRNSYRRKFRQQNKAQFAEYEGTEVFKQKTFAKNLRKNYGLSVEDFEKMEAKQDGKCAVCLRPEFHKTKKRLSVDHCHTTGQIRGLLCHRCNVVLGLVNEDLRIIESVTQYLKG